jgi:tRNA threonylcarbamoyladenosine biosynthesis protein TsaB
MAEVASTEVLASPLRGLVLAVDSTLGRSSVALAVRGELRGTLAAEGDGKGKLPRLVATLLGAEGIAPRDLDAVVVGVGPGRFTGVRSAVAVAKGLAWALRVPLAAVGSLEVLAAPGSCERDGWVVLGDGPRNIYAVPCARGADPVSVELAAFVEARLCERKPALEIMGAALDPLREALRGAGVNVRFVEHRLDAQAHLTLALRNARLVNVHDAEPSYVREASITSPTVAPALLAFR